MRIAVFNCDLYADVSQAWYALYEKFWPESPYDVIYVTNRKEIDVPCPVAYIQRPDIDYGGRLKTFLHSHCSDHLVLITMADYLLQDRVDHNVIERAVELCRKRDVRHCRLRPMPRPELSYPEEGFARVRKGRRYSLSLQPGIWESNVLYSLVRNGEDPWETEIRGSTRTNSIRGKFLSTEEHVMAHHNYYRKGEAMALDWVAEHVPHDCWPDAVRAKHGN